MKTFATLLGAVMLFLSAPAMAETFDGLYDLDYPSITFNFGVGIAFGGTSTGVWEECPIDDNAEFCFYEGEEALTAFVASLPIPLEDQMALMEAIAQFYDDVRASIMTLKEILPDQMELDRWWVLLGASMYYEDTGDTAGMAGIIDPETGEYLLGAASWPAVDGNWAALCAGNVFALLAGTQDPVDYAGGGEYLVQEAGVCSVLGALVVVDFGLSGDYTAMPVSDTPSDAEPTPAAEPAAD